MAEREVKDEERRFRAAVAAAAGKPDYDAICAAEKIHPTRLAWLIQRMEAAARPVRSRPAKAAEPRES